MFDDIARLRTTRTRSISPENPDGSTGGGARATEGTGAHAARELGRGWKVSPSVVIGGHSTHDLAVIDEPGRITHIWLTTHRDHWRSLVLRAYWDGDHEPAIEVPVGDFFASGWGRFAKVSSAMVAVNPHGGFNSYWPMPFGSSAHLTLENLSPDDATVYYQVTYDTGPGVAGAEDGFGHLHAQFRRSNPLVEGETHPILRGVAGRGHYAGTYLAWGVNSTCWWGEGEVKFYLDGDDEFPSIAGTGTEDYFGGAWNFDVPDAGYTEFSTPYLGFTGDPPRRRLRVPTAVRDVPVARTRSDHVHPRHHRGGAGARLAAPRALPPADRRHQLRRLVLPRPDEHDPPRTALGERPGAVTPPRLRPGGGPALSRRPAPVIPAGRG
ncbi:glycoside hydrolase family 172 protein [Microlunatus sp. Y2014]|uniref:glycoside hydrolase family 172 protein n=1 Tax=Microlunatus sp. Y2014 TaxID=3418488 RepID=UPI003DA6FFF5